MKPTSEQIRRSLSRNEHSLEKLTFEPVRVPTRIPSPHMQGYLSPLRQRFLADLAPSILARGALPVLSRDGLLGLLDYFRWNPMPRAVDQLLLVNRRFAALVPEAWQESVAFYSHRVPTSRSRELRSAGELIVVFTVLDRAHASDVFVALMLGELKSFYGARLKHMRIRCLLLNGIGPEVAERGFNQMRALFRELGEQLELCTWKDLQQSRLHGTAFIDLNEHDFHYSDSAVVQYLLRSGSNPFHGRPRSESCDFWVASSPFHGIQVDAGGEPSFEAARGPALREMKAFLESSAFQLDEEERALAPERALSDTCVLPSAAFQSLCLELARIAVPPVECAEATGSAPRKSESPALRDGLQLTEAPI